MKSIKKQLEGLRSFKEREIHKSAGILDDHSVRKSIATREATITKTPSVDYDVANKKYVDDSIAAIPPSSGYWDRTGTTLHPDTSGDSVQTDTRFFINNSANYFGRWADSTDDFIVTPNNLRVGGAGFNVLSVDKDNEGVCINGYSPDSNTYQFQINNAEEQGSTNCVYKYGDALMRFTNDGSHGYFGMNSNHDLRLRTNWTDRVTVSTSGYVGIGTTSPAWELEVNGKIKSTRIGLGTKDPNDSYTIIADGAWHFAFQSGGQELLCHTDSSVPTIVSNYGAMRLFANNGKLYLKSSTKIDAETSMDIYGGLIVNENGADIDTRIEGDTDTHLLFCDAGLEMVGIGESTPTAKLQVNSKTAQLNSVLTNSITTEANSAVRLDFLHAQSGGQKGNSSARIEAIKLGAFTFGTASTLDAGLAFSTINDNTLAERMRITNEGKVGVGTTTPSESIHSTAKIRANTCFNVNGTDGITQFMDIEDNAGLHHKLWFVGGILTAYATE